MGSVTARSSSSMTHNHSLFINFRSLCTQRWHVHARSLQKLHLLTGISGKACTSHARVTLVKVQCSTLGSTLEDKCFSFFSTDWRWQWWRTSNSAVADPIVWSCLSCSYVLLVEPRVHKNKSRQLSVVLLWMLAYSCSYVDLLVGPNDEHVLLVEHVQCKAIGRKCQSKSPARELCNFSNELRILPWQTPCMELPTLVLMYSWSNQEYIRTRVGNSRSFCYECCHGRIRSSSSLPTSVCTKNGKTFILERWTQRWTLYFDEHVHAKCRPSLKCQSKRWSFWRERACTCSALSA